MAVCFDRPDIRGYMAPTADLFGVANFSGINLSLWGIPEELQLRLDYPVERAADWYFYEQQPEVCRIAYCPTGNSVQENDFKLISFVQKTNARSYDRLGSLSGNGGCIPSRSSVSYRRKTVLLSSKNPIWLSLPGGTLSVPWLSASLALSWGIAVWADG